MQRKNENSSTGSASPETGDGETFLGRWSRRKQHARTKPEDGAAVEPPVPASDVPSAEDQSPERVLTDEDMPPLDSLDSDSDYGGFLSPGVSEKLRHAALRKLFLSPKFNFVDGLDDYADDFTVFEPLGDIITADMRHQMELAEERAKKAMEEELAVSNEEISDQATDVEDAAERDDKEDTSAASEEQSADAKDVAADGANLDDASDDGTRTV